MKFSLASFSEERTKTEQHLHKNTSAQTIEEILFYKQSKMAVVGHIFSGPLVTIIVILDVA